MESFVSVPFFDLMDGFVLVIRNPLYSALSEFNRRYYGQVKGFASDDHFKTKAAANFGPLFQKQMELMAGFVRRYSNITKPVLFISYDDLQRYLLPQLLRLALFFNLSTDPDVLERSICTVYSSKRIESFTKRKKNVDLQKLAASLIDKGKAIENLIRVNEILIRSQLHFLRMSEYKQCYDYSWTLKL